MPDANPDPPPLGSTASSESDCRRERSCETNMRTGTAAQARHGIEIQRALGGQAWAAVQSAIKGEF